MEGAENTTVSMLLDEAMEGNEGFDESANNTMDDTENDVNANTETPEDPDNEQLSQNILDSEAEGVDVACPGEKLPDGFIENNTDNFTLAVEDGNQNEALVERCEEGIEMIDDTIVSKENILNADDQAHGDIQEDESLEMLGETEDFTDGEFISQTNPLLVQNEPPQQLMEDADIPGDEQTNTDANDSSEMNPATDAEAADHSEDAFTYVEGEQNETTQGDEDEGLLLQQGGDPEQSVADSPETPLEREETESQLMASQLDGEADDRLENQEEEAVGEHVDHTMPMPLEDEATAATENEDTEGFDIVAGADQLEGSLRGLEGKLVVGADGTVHLLTPESLQGMQLMEGDDKPEDQVNGEDAAAQIQQDIRAQLHEALLKQEEIKQEEGEKEPEEESPAQDEPNAEGGALATLASAALGHQAPANGVKIEPDAPEAKPDANEPQWMDVGICKGTHCVVRSFYIPSEGQSWDKNWEGINTSTLPDHRALAKLELEAGKAYKFRVAAINSCGRGPWSEISAFRTSMPGVPGAPSAIKISKTVEGAHLSWEPPSATSGIIEDYTVYMAVRSATTDSQVVSSGANQLAFVRIYQGAENQCSVGFETLSEAHIDTTTKAAILFRIAARNEKGLGPAIQVRWLQDGSIPNQGVKPINQQMGAVRRIGSEIKPHGSIKRKKSECE